MEGLICEFKDKAELKWLLVDPLCRFPLVGPNAPGRALELAESAMVISPSPAHLGMVYYRAGRWLDCIRLLEKVTDVPGRNNITAFLFLAMAHWQTGDKDRARRIYEQTIAFLARTGYPDYWLRYTQAEAAELLGAAKANDYPVTNRRP